MKIFFKIIIVGIFLVGFGESRANTLFESLQSAYSSNSNLNAESASMRASKEEKKEAVSEFLPSITLSGDQSSATSSNRVNQSGVSLSDTNLDTESKHKHVDAYKEQHFVEMKLKISKRILKKSC